MSMQPLYTEDLTFDIEGLEVTVRVKVWPDEESGPPEDMADGHGPVSGWKRLAGNKKPGEVILHLARGAFKTYDFAEAIKMAKRDGWNAEPYLEDYVVLRWEDTGEHHPLFLAGKAHTWARDRGAARRFHVKNDEEALREALAAQMDMGRTCTIAPAETRKMRALKAVEADLKFLRGWYTDQWCYVGVEVVLLDQAGEETEVTDSVWGFETYRDGHLTEARRMAEDLAKGLGTVWGPVVRDTYARLAN